MTVMYDPHSIQGNNQSTLIVLSQSTLVLSKGQSYIFLLLTSVAVVYPDSVLLKYLQLVTLLVHLRSLVVWTMVVIAAGVI